MPLYEYDCPRCKKVHEVMQKFADAPLQECPECHGPVTKLMSLGSFALKGQGWYVTDYKRKGGDASGSSPASSPIAAPASTPSAPAAPAAAPAKTKDSSPAKSG